MKRLAWFVLCVGAAAQAAVEVEVSPEKITNRPEGRRHVQTFDISNAVGYYQLTYDYIAADEQTNRITSHWWAWKGRWVTIGMTRPTMANWYWQGFFNWRFDDCSLYDRRARVRVLRRGGADALVEFAWDLPNARARIWFALPTRGDMLLMFGRYEPKRAVKRCELRLSCYPATFSAPHNRCVTTALGTVNQGRKTLDLSRERWLLLEDATPHRAAAGSAGLVVGAPDAWQSVQVNATGYQLAPRLTLKPDARAFALALYSFPAMPDLKATREYFRRSGDRQSAWLSAALTTFLARPLPAWPLAEGREAALAARAERLFRRPVERWRPASEPLAFPWARPLAGGPVRTVILCPRWAAYETMELARRIDLDARHVYFDSRSVLADPKMWPYRATTGIGPVSRGLAALRAARLCAARDAEVFLVSHLAWSAIPAACRATMLEQARNGKGLLLVGADAGPWPKELFRSPAPETAAAALDGFPWPHMPGYRRGDEGRRDLAAPLRAFRYGNGRVVWMPLKQHRYSALVPLHGDYDGLEAAADRSLALSARALLVAAGRPGLVEMRAETAGQSEKTLVLRLRPAPAAGATVLARVQDELGAFSRVLPPAAVRGGATRIPLPRLPAGRAYFVDYAARDARGRVIGFGSTRLAAPAGPRIEIAALSPSRRACPGGTPRVERPEGGELSVRIIVRGPRPPAGARLRVEARDAFGRLVGRAEIPAPTPGRAVEMKATLLPPVTVCHYLDAALTADGRVLAVARRRFTLPLAYPYDDFTALLWSYAGAAPALRETQRRCYELGADMMDLCHMGRFADAAADREYWAASWSGLRVLPYVTRLAGKADSRHYRRPCLHDPKYRARAEAVVRACSRPAWAFSPAAFTLGDENYLFRGPGECCHRPESVAAFRRWLARRYGDVAKLNAEWGSQYADFDAIQRPMLMEEAAKQTRSFAAWLDHKRFMDTAFARAHERLAEVIRREVPGAKVGWDGFLGYSWRSGYDFVKLTRRLDLNQTYVGQWLQGQFVRSFKSPGALSGQWGNRVANNAAGFSGFAWECLLEGDNSVWWWTSWGCDYTPFSPDLSVNAFGEAFFKTVREIKAGPGKLLLHARRSDGRIAVLYSQPDLLAAELFAKVSPGAAFAGAGNFWREHEALLRGLRDLGYQYRYVSYDALEEGKVSRAEFDVLVLCLASCLSDRQAATVREFVRSGGALLAVGRPGLLDGRGRIRLRRPLDDVLGVRSPAGLAAVKPPAAAMEGAWSGWAAPTRVNVWEPGVRCAGAHAQGRAGAAPLMTAQAFGRGRAILVNFSLKPILSERVKPGPKPALRAWAAALKQTAARRPCELSLPDGAAPLCTQRILYEDGPIRYMAIQQDLRRFSQPAQKLRVTLPAPAVVYDVRAGRRVGRGRVSTWSAAVSRGEPLLYALLPYEVKGVEVSAPREGRRGELVEARVRVAAAAGEPGFHVVRLNVFAPGARTPHRQYSQNVSCPAGRGTARIPFAFNDPPGAWRLEFRDVASGARAARTIVLRR